MKYIILFFVFIQISSLPQQSYQPLGGPYGGEIGDISIAPNGDIFAGAFPFGQTFSDGLYKSTDKGKTWVECSTNSIYRLQVLSILNSKSNEIWVGTYWSGRLFFSSDYGLTWEIRNNGLDDNTYCWD